MAIYRSLPILATAAILAGAPLAHAQTRTDGTSGNPPSTATGRAVDRAQGEVPRPDGTPANPPGTAVGRAVDSTPGPSTTGANPTPTGTAAGTSTTAPTTATPTMTVDAARLRGAMSAQQLMDADVYGANDREVGEVEDIIIPQGGTGDLVVVLSVGGFLGMGERHVAVPFRQLQHNAERNRWVLPGATEETLRAMPVFNLDEFGRNRNRASTDRGGRNPAVGTPADGTSRPGASSGTGAAPGQTTPANPPTR